MSEFVKQTVSARCKLITCVFLLSGPLTSAADDSIRDDLKRCSSIEDAAARLVCYDGISGRQAPSQAAATSPIDPPHDKSLDEPGSESVRRDNDEKDETLAIRATVTKCRQDANDKYYFYFDNGEVWKQSDGKRVRLRDCSFDVTITKDFFGHKMRPDGEKWRIRVARVK